MLCVGTEEVCREVFGFDCNLLSCIDFLSGFLLCLL